MHMQTNVIGFHLKMYENHTIIHKRNFVDPENMDVHSQSVENLWMGVKRKLCRQFGTSEDLFPTYLHNGIYIPP